MRRPAMRTLAVPLLALVLPLACARTAQAQAQPPSRPDLIPLLPPSMEEPSEEPTPQESKATQRIRADLANEQFAELDQMAESFRQTKARVAGGAWRLRQFYASLMLPAQPTDEAVQTHLTHLQHWMTQRPDSITPWIAAAETLHQWAWVARGGGTSDTVTDAGWKLFQTRIDREVQVLQTAGRLEKLDPQWFSETMSVGLAAGWDRPKMQDIFDRGTQFEPGYYDLYRDYANYLLPKWYGKPGDATAFARTEADRVGGDEGDLIYFYVATVVIKRGNGGIPTKEMDWQRIKHGESVLEKRFGATRTHTNQLAFMAYQYRDRATAAPLFATIGERWAPAIWKDKASYDKARQWAAGTNPATRPGQTPNQTPPGLPDQGLANQGQPE